MKKNFRSGCPIASSLDLLGDKWSLLIIRDMLVHHKTTFRDLSASDEHIAPSILSARLKLLESYGLITKQKLPENQKENIYLLTEKGMALTPVLVEYTLWGDRHLRAYNTIDDIPGLSTDKALMIESIKNGYADMVEAVLG